MYDPRERRSDHRSPSSRGERSGSGSGHSHPSRQQGEPPRRPKKKKRRSAGRTAGLVLLYVTAVIGVSVLLACVGWVAAGDVLALNKEYKEVTFTVTPEDDFDSILNRMEEEGLIEYKLDRKSVV